MSIKNLLVMAVIGLSTVAYSQPGGARTSDIRRHQMREMAPLQGGVRTGRLTRAEEARLWREQRVIHGELQTAKEYGGFDRVERARIRHDQKAASEDIYRLKHNSTERAGS